MNYLIVMHQSGGCDYTIGCGCKVVLTEPNAKGITDALDGHLDVESDSRLSRVEVYEVAKILPFDLRAAEADFAAKAEAEAKASTLEAKELAELARLEDKYGDMGDDEIAHETAMYQRLKGKYLYHIG